MSTDDGPGTREVAHRLFAAEFEDADFEYSESDEERAPNYVVTPTGARVNRLFVVGVLTEVETVNENTLRGRAVDPTGAFVSYAGQYQPDEMAFLDRTRPPAFVALTGKARTFQPEDSDVVYTSVRPERFNEVDAETRDRWTVSAAEATLRRVAVMRDARRMDASGDALREELERAGVRPSIAAGVALALDHYETGERYLEAVRRVAVEALEVVADDREEVSALDVSPGERGSVDFGPLPAGVAGVERDAAASAGEPESAGTADASSDTDASEDAVAEFDTGDVADAFDPDEESAGEATTNETSTGDAPTATDETTTVAAADETSTAATDETATVAETDEASTAATGDTTTATDESSVTSATGDGPTGGDAVAESSATDEELATAGSATGADATTGASGGADTNDETTDPGSFDVGGFDEDSTTETDAPTDDTDDLGSFDPEEDDALSEEERAEVEEEFGVGFSSGSEVPEPEESELDAPDPEEITPDPAATGDSPVESPDSSAEPDAAAADSGIDTDTSDEPVAATDASSETETSSATEPADPDTAEADEASDVDLTTAVVEIMGELDEGDGADREKVKAAAIQRHGATPDDAENAIQDALMNGQCYEAGDGLKPI